MCNKQNDLCVVFEQQINARLAARGSLLIALHDEVHNVRSASFKALHLCAIIIYLYLISSWQLSL